MQTRLLQGNDGVKKWEDQCLWDAVLKNVRVVVSTYKILLDALANDFVKLERISLLIFDEGRNRFHYQSSINLRPGVVPDACPL